MTDNKTPNLLTEEIEKQPVAKEQSFYHLIEKLNLKKHPEGGYYSEIYRDQAIIKKDNLPNEFSGDRNYSTAIYYLLNGNNFSVFHRIKSDEGWHYYIGNTSLKIYEIRNDGELIIHKLGSDIDRGETLFAVVEKGSWFAVELDQQNEDNFTLVGCTAAPGFDKQDFELANSDRLAQQFPQHLAIIRKLART
ncbi:hypothetical protein RclHR1_06000002 [Rhizophagus clarus]|uniref:Cupin domain-containing protein n=1 Tax=Rhizophagus clarus TaxID=94130 RepID=A0A2Z6RPW6_9GLOM|nr:hypothetical protein RclHR1_06000002 [Rhizophagus clarus]GES86304.1 cupin domain-containing protein [Rhizophagus clarus]